MPGGIILYRCTKLVNYNNSIHGILFTIILLLDKNYIFLTWLVLNCHLVNRFNDLVVFVKMSFPDNQSELVRGAILQCLRECVVESL